MARTPLIARVTAPSFGGLTYTVPSGKLLVCNAYYVSRTDAYDYENLGFGQSDPFTRLALNGVFAVVLDFAYQLRTGPFVFNAGDVISCLAGLDEGATPGAGFSLHGFLYDQSTRKTPLNQILTVGSSSYTVPAGKDAVVSLYAPPAGSAYQLKVNGTRVAFLYQSVSIAFRSIRQGPYCFSAGQTISFAYANTNYTPGDKIWASGFLYNV